jgi:hypothetical protein
MEVDGKVLMPHFMVVEMHQAQWVSSNKYTLPFYYFFYF